MVSINNIPNSFKNGARKFITKMTDPDALAPVILLEAAVTAGRTYQAYQRGGFVEARERGTEETLGAIFWLGGVSAFNKLGDMAGQKYFGLNELKDMKFDAAEDAVRKPFKNFVQKNVKNSRITENKLTAFKFGRTMASILLANAIIGFVVPKINQRITKHYQESLKKAEAAKTARNKVVNTPAFKGLGVGRLLSLSDKFEHDAKYKLLSTDVGIAGGRAVNARNKHERTEVLVRDVGSIYFYMFCKNHINAGLNLLQTGKAERLDPISAQKINRAISLHIGNGASVDRKFLFGDETATIPAEIKFKTHKDSKIETITLKEFEEAVGSDIKIAAMAKRMSRLQPKLAGVGAILTKEQVLDLYQGGLINRPGFLNNVYSKFTGGKSTNPHSFVPEKDLRALKSRMVDYVEDIIKTAEKSGTNVTEAVLKKVNNKNLLINGINLGLGLGVSALFLSTIIPKIQYWITQKHTGENKFPGVQQYDK